MKKTTALLCALALAAPVALAQQKPDAKVQPAKAAAPAAAKAEAPAETKKESKMMKTESGLGYEDLVVGTGPSPVTGQTCVMHYTGWLWVNEAKGTKFDSSVDRGTPFEFPIGRGRVIKGWDEGVSTMKVGGKRTLLIPPQLGYGDRGAGNVIPPGATLLFEVELLGVK
ncbi:MAG TPA: FKBP-type peptidyl-prolyl cis-trans isomerase [Thermoanaerobaculia bacterium]|nr:FKBP-type peptidyl-prolyl cis-trans isomerase [Thermoanaerobaculia bacterium]